MGYSRLNFNFTKIIDIFFRPSAMEQQALTKMSDVKDLLRDITHYHCSPDCNICCYGSILMSYTEYLNLLCYLRNKWTPDKIENLCAEKLGTIEEDKKLLCPFLNEEATEKHCRVYDARPLICRVFGTTVAPCEELAENVKLPEVKFYMAYDRLYYTPQKKLIGIPVSEYLLLFEAPFDFWCIADSGEQNRHYLLDLIENKGSMNAVIYDSRAREFFVVKDGNKQVIASG